VSNSDSIQGPAAPNDNRDAFSPLGDQLAATSSAARGTLGSVAERWAFFVLDAINADRDPKTISTWAKTIGVSRSALCECCRLVHVSPHTARDFTRLLRAICRSGAKWQPETVLDVADMRTLKKLLSRAGLSATLSVTPSAEQFLVRQDWIPEDNAGLIALQQHLPMSRRVHTRYTHAAASKSE
jgi:hypothetical protein